MAVNPRILGVKTMRRAKNSPISPWQKPVMSPRWYTLFCCDCALAHRFQFKVRGKQVQFRVKRANLYTQMKRKHKSEKGQITILKKGEAIRALVDGAMVLTLVNGLRRGGGKVERKKKGKSRGRSKS